jgi:hypothetical protein
MTQWRFTRTIKLRSAATGTPIVRIACRDFTLTKADITSWNEYCAVKTKGTKTKIRRLLGILQVSNLLACRSPGSIYYALGVWHGGCSDTCLGPARRSHVASVTTWQIFSFSLPDPKKKKLLPIFKHRYILRKTRDRWHRMLNQTTSHSARTGFCLTNSMEQSPP